MHQSPTPTTRPTHVHAEEHDEPAHGGDGAERVGRQVAYGAEELLHGQPAGEEQAGRDEGVRDRRREAHQKVHERAEGQHVQRHVADPDKPGGEAVGTGLEEARGVLLVVDGAVREDDRDCLGGWWWWCLWVTMRSRHVSLCWTVDLTPIYPPYPWRSPWWR